MNHALLQSKKPTILIQISLKIVHKPPIENKVSIASGNGLVPSGKNSLPEPMLTKIPDHIWHHCGRSQCVNSLWPGVPYDVIDLGYLWFS